MIIFISQSVNISNSRVYGENGFMGLWRKYNITLLRIQIKNAKIKQRMMATKEAKRIAMRIASMHTRRRSRRNIIMTPIETARKITLKMAMMTPIKNIISRANVISNVSQDSREEDSNTEETRMKTVR